MPYRFLILSLARYRRSKGLYDKLSLRYFAASWMRFKSPLGLLEYALFRRDIGRPLPRRWCELLKNFLPGFSSVQRCLALGLLAETQPDALQVLPVGWLNDAVALPAVASCLQARVGESGIEHRIDSSQLAWREAFASWLVAAGSSGGICVVGNAATLKGRGLGAAVDRCAAVVRFNHYMGSAGLAADVGCRTDVWVVSPGYSGPAPEDVSWVVMTGPDMRYRLKDWRNVMPLLNKGVPVLTVPLAVWRGLVGQLQAPPSAGLLTLAWLHFLQQERWQGLHALGIGAGLSQGGRYHATLARHVASSRHAWDREKEIVAGWRAAGLTELTQHGFV